MLVITQQEGDILQIGPDVRIMIRRVRGGWVRLAVDAPDDILIERIPTVAGSTAPEEPGPAPVTLRRPPRKRSE